MTLLRALIRATPDRDHRVLFAAFARRLEARIRRRTAGPQALAHGR